VSDQIGVGDFYTLKSDSSLKGIVERVWHDTDADPYTVKNRFLVHKDLPDHVREQLKRTKLLPENFVVLRLLWSPRVDILVHTSDLVLIDKYFSRGDVVKRNSSDAQSGTVIGTSCSCNLRPHVSVTEGQNERALRVDFAPKDTEIANVDTHELEPYQSWNVGDTVIFGGWVGTIKDIDCATTVRLEENGSVVVVDDAKDVKRIVPSIPRDFAYVRLSGKPKKREGSSAALQCYPGQRVRVKKSSLAKGRWISGTFNAGILPTGVVLNVRCAMIQVHWRMPRSDVPATTVAAKPAVFLMEEQLDSGDVKNYGFSRSPDLAHGVEDPFASVTNMVPSEFVIRKDTNATRLKHVCVSGDWERQIEPLSFQFELPSGSLLRPDVSVWFVAEITSTTSRVKVQWQDNSITDELSSGICSYNEVDDHDVWPGEIVSLKGPETIQQDLEFERMLRTRAVGVVQSVNAVERIARIRWFKGADITITGEDYTVLVRPHSKLGKITEEITESSLYEIGSYHALTKRRGDLVRLERRPKETLGQGGISWVGEVMDLLPNGWLLVRLGSLDKARDIKCSVLDITTVLSADDDTTDSDSSGSESSDEWEDDTIMAGQWPGSTLIEYEGSAPSDHDEQEWETDSDDHAATGSEASMDQDEPQAIVPPVGLTPMDVDSSNETSELEKNDSREEPPTIESRSGPAAFEVLEGSAPKQATLAGSGSHSKEWLRAVYREHKILRTSLPQGVYVRTWESDMELLRVLIIGPSGTPYAHAPFLFDITLHSRFPTEAPTAFFHSWTNGVGRANPNLYENGKVCLSLLGTWEGDDDEEEWVAGKSTVLQIIVSLLGLVLVKEPFYNEAGFEALQGTAQSKPTSAVYSEKAYVLSRGFVAKALQCVPAGCEDIIEWLYLPSRNGPSLLRTIMSDCQRFLQQDTHAVTEEESSAHQRLNLERYHIDSAKLSKGILILLRKMVPDLEDLLRYEERLLAEARQQTSSPDQAMEVEGTA
ncbi:MAG: hypothetical protein Q9199_008113, partial [Rusavskia elegans]